jgi:hypothetical protein
VLYGALTGTVRDSSGAALPAASIRITHQETNLARETVANESGLYTFQSVLPGPHTLAASLAGFKEHVQTGVLVMAAEITRVELTLEIGPLVDTVTVRSDALLLQTDKADVRFQLRGAEIADLPLNVYRNYQRVLELFPGATAARFTNAVTDSPERALPRHFNGTNRNNNSTRLDGATTTNVWLPHLTAYVPPPETIDSVTISTSSFDAELGLAGGAAITVITRSGTNQLHGSAFGLYDDEDLRAKNFFFSSQPKPESARTSAGATLGGPLSKDRWFFFGGYEGTFERLGFSRRTTLASEQLRRGDFSHVTQIIYDPRTGNPDGTERRPFPDNRIPPDGVHPVAQRWLALIPASNEPGDVNNFARAGTQRLDRHNYDLKISVNRRSGQQLWGKYSRMDARVVGESILGQAGGSCLCDGLVGTGWTRAWERRAWTSRSSDRTSSDASASISSAFQERTGQIHGRVACRSSRLPASRCWEPWAPCHSFATIAVGRDRQT